VSSRVIVNVNYLGLDDDKLIEVLTHELTHVALGATTTGYTPIWLQEGVANYVSYPGAPGRQQAGTATSTARCARPWAAPRSSSPPNGGPTCAASSPDELCPSSRAAGRRPAGRWLGSSAYRLFTPAPTLGRPDRKGTSMPTLSQVDPTTASGPAAALLAGVQKAFGVVPNMMKVMANSPALLKGCLDLSAALAGGVLPAGVRERLALATAEFHACSYCLSAHTFVAANVVKVPVDELARARWAQSDDPHTEAILTLSDAIVRGRGQVEDATLRAARDAGVSDAEIAEIIGNIALNVLTNYFNIVADVENEWPAVPAR
jgi:uncharacterized peroxidase-related enzyme